ncbi:MAG TPA: 50S ribosomal protein L24 [Syntrophomonadaceae bacterium]|nr:50S ribosomal protein L24 [Syntrophomonadaceae bacterium]
MSIKKGDTVLVLTGKDAGKKGKILRVVPKDNRIVVEGVNKVKKHQKPNRAIPQGGIQKIEAPLNASNVLLICSHCGKPTRIGQRVLDSNEKVRICKKCGEILE